MRNGILAGLLAATLAAGAAHAGDLGGKGDCCADLEERVQELEASTARKGGRKVTLTVSGQISRSILWYSAEGQSDHVMVDNFNSPSRLTFTGEGKMGKDWSAGFLMEFGLADASVDVVTSTGTVTTTPVGGVNILGFPAFPLLSFTGAPSVTPIIVTGTTPSNEVVIRHQAVWLGTPLGKVWLGHTSSATDGIVEINLASGINVAALPMAAHLGFDGDRQQVLKWESPSLSGFSASASYTSDGVLVAEQMDAALRYAGEFSGIRVAAGVGYADLDGIARISGSASVMHVLSGMFLTVQAGQLDVVGDPKVYGASAGIEKNFFGIGATTVFAEYSKGENVLAVLAPLGLSFALADLEVYGLGFNQAIDQLGADLFLSYRHLAADSEEADAVMGGMRVRF